jgi:hypothetical protein
MDKKLFFKRCVIALGAVGVLVVTVTAGALAVGFRIVDVPVRDGFGKMQRVVGLPLYGYSLIDTVSAYCSRQFPNSGAIGDYERTECKDNAVRDIAAKKFVRVTSEWATTF